MLTTEDLTCEHCGYSLRGLVDCTCPECGRAFDPVEMLDRLQNRRSTIKTETVRFAAQYSITIAILSIVATALTGVMLVHDIARSWGAHCGTFLRSDMELVVLMGLFCVVTSWVPFLMAIAAHQFVTLARLSAIATTTAWLTEWLLIQSI